MVRLKEQYKRNGYIHNLVWRDNNYAISKLLDNETERFVCFEAFRIKVRESGPKNSEAEYPRESTPSNEEWGKFGYSVHTIQEAFAKIEMMKARNKNKNKN